MEHFVCHSLADHAWRGKIAEKVDGLSLCGKFVNDEYLDTILKTCTICGTDTFTLWDML